MLADLTKRISKEFLDSISGRNTDEQFSQFIHDLIDKHPSDYEYKIQQAIAVTVVRYLEDMIGGQEPEYFSYPLNQFTLTRSIQSMLHSNKLDYDLLLDRLVILAKQPELILTVLHKAINNKTKGLTYDNASKPSRQDTKDLRSLLFNALGEKSHPPLQNHLATFCSHEEHIFFIKTLSEMMFDHMRDYPHLDTDSNNNMRYHLNSSLSDMVKGCELSQPLYTIAMNCLTKLQRQPNEPYIERSIIEPARWYTP